jgi:TonB family protein
MVGVTSRSAVRWVLLLGFLPILQLAPLSMPRSAAAQDQPINTPVVPRVGNEREEQPKPPVIVPPKVKQFAEPTFPPDALAQGLSGRVEVELVVGVDGHTSDLKIKTPAGHGFDEAALEAAARLVFEPATRDGTPIPARIVFPYVFEYKAPEPAVPAEPPPPPPAQFRGRVLETGAADAPIIGVEIILSNGDPAQTRRQVTTSDGAFDFGELEGGQYHVTLSKPEWTTQEADETLTPGEETKVVYRLVPELDKEAFHATARVPPPPREVTRRSIPKEELTRIPGTRGDALRTVELLPGVARPPYGSGVIIVRGSSPQDTQVLLEGIPVALLYHFGGLTSFINSRLLESVDFYPGNFSVRYGRRRGGIVEAKLADPDKDHLHGVLDLNLIDGSVLAEGPITDKWQFAGAARRSWLDLTLSTALKSTDVTTIAAPVYYDYQALTTYRPSDKDKLRLLVYGSSDQFKLLFQNPSDDDPAVSGNFKLATTFHRVHGTWSRKVSDRVDHDLEIAAGVYNYAFGAGDAFDFSLKGSEYYLRSEWRMRVTDKVRLIAGLDGAVLPGEVVYGGPPLQQQEGSPMGGGGTAASNQSKINTSDKFTVFEPAAYLESDLDLHPVRIVLGSRVDYYNETKSVSFDPRVAVIYSLTDNTKLKGGFGFFSQPPQFQESSPAFGNPHLKPTHTIHTDVGIDQTIAPGVQVGVEGFYKYLYDRVIGTDYGLPPTFINGGRGRIWGLEVSAKVNPTGRFFGYLSYTLSRSEREDHNEGYKLFDYDQPHILTLSGVYRLGRGWEAGLTFRLVAGNPTTPIVGALFNKDTGLYSPVYGAVNSIRNPYFHRLDLRVEKLWTFSHWKFAAYVDVQNVYNATNAEGIAYDFEYRQMMNVRGIPILPNLGVRGEL